MHPLAQQLQFLTAPTCSILRSIAVQAAAVGFRVLFDAAGASRSTSRAKSVDGAPKPTARSIAPVSDKE